MPNGLPPGPHRDGPDWPVSPMASPMAMSPQVRAAWQMEHMANAVAASQATSMAIANAQMQMTAQANAHAATVGELQMILAQLAQEVGAVPDALSKVQAAQMLVAQL